jgi:hypothetical protein
MAKVYVAKKVQEEKITEQTIDSLAGLFIMKLTNEDRQTLSKIIKREYKEGFLNGMQLQKNINN